MRQLRFVATTVVFLLPTLFARAQLSDFGDRAVELRGLTSEEFAKPDLPEDAITNAPPGAVTHGVARPLALVYRYYSGVPWLNPSSALSSRRRRAYTR